MANTPWQPCPRCHSHKVTVTPNAASTAGTVAAVIIVLAVLAFVAKVVEANRGADGAHTIALFILLGLGALIFGPIIAAIVAAGSALIGAVASTGVTGYHAKCNTCSFEWEIPEPQPRTPTPRQNSYAPPYNFPPPPGKR